ncbi:MAG: membrane-associated phospholipid phosphatase [Granulosicoccus sp.]|jgi:membrane-associated phospholipid phosphatase
MKKIFRNNIHYISCCILFFLFGGVLLFFIEKPDAIFFFSERRTPFLDLFFTYFTKMGEEVMYLVFLISFLFVKIRYAILIPLIGIAVSIISYLAKSFFAHDRPLMYLENMNLADQVNFVEGIQLLIGKTSFPSGHTMSAFALYGLVAFMFSRKKIWGVILFAFALLIGMSRNYLVQHFYQDIYLGALIGFGLSILFYWGQGKFILEENHWLNKPIWKRKDNVRA